MNHRIFIDHLDRVVESLEDADALGAQLQVHQPFHGQKDAVVLQRLLTDQHDDTSHRLLHTQKTTLLTSRLLPPLL